VTARIYVPLTSTGLAALVADGRLTGGFRAHAVTDALRAEWPDGDDEAWEYAAMYAAADSSLALALGRAGAADRPRRYVVAADVPTAEPVAGDDPTLVSVAADVPWKNVAALHADTVDVDAGSAEDADLAWFATQEIRHFVDDD